LASTHFQTLPSVHGQVYAVLMRTSTSKAVSTDLLVPFSVPPEELTGCISVFDGRAVKRIPFAQLVADVTRARSRLEQAGLTALSCVGIIGENCYEWIVHDLAVLSLGCISICFPIDEFAAQSAEKLAEGYDLSLLLVTQKVGMRPDLPWVVVMNASSVSTAIVRPLTQERGLRKRMLGTDACTVIFSSGTSGQLKALLLSRAGVDATIDALANDWQMGSNDRILVALPLSIFQQRLMVYAALRKDTEILLTDSANLFRSFKVMRPTIVLGPPALFEAIENRFSALPSLQGRALCLASDALRVVPLKSVREHFRRRLFHKTHEALGGWTRVLITGSAPSKLSTLKFFYWSGLSLFQAYGLAEVGFIAWNRPGYNRLLSVGHPVFPGSVAIAEDGEIIVSVQHAQALGYFGIAQAEEARTFLPDGRIATGDLGRFDDDGYLYIIGRKKNLILLQSGEKINPESLELQLGTPPGVDRVVVIGGGNMSNLVAVVAVDAECTPEQEVRIRSEIQSAIDHLNQRVKPASRIVRFIVTRVAFHPETGLVTRNLKLDRGAVYRFFERDLSQNGLQASGAHSS
jgi:long-chain acyl-CoA synthetase